jgi:hypothetical protein
MKRPGGNPPCSVSYGEKEKENGESCGVGVYAGQGYVKPVVGVVGVVVVGEGESFLAKVDSPSQHVRSESGTEEVLKSESEVRLMSMIGPKAVGEGEERKDLIVDGLAL